MGRQSTIESRRTAAVSNTSSPFGQNEWLVEEMYRKFRDDPSSVDPSWHEFLVDYNPEPTAEAAPSAPAASPDGQASPAPEAKPAAPETKPAPAPTGGNGASVPA